MTWLKKIFNKTDSETNYEPETSREEQGLVLRDEESEEDAGQLALDVYQTKDNLIIRSTIAGVKPEDLDITVSSDAVTIKGKRKQEEEIRDEDYYYQECYWGAFSRSVSLPVEVDADRVTADLKDGILTLTLPKASRARIKKVRIRGQE